MNSSVITSLLCLFALFCLGACPVHPVPPQPPIPHGPATCADACARASQLRCDFAKPTAGGASCETVCQNIQDSGIVALDLGCRVAAATCEAAEACEQ